VTEFSRAPALLKAGLTRSDVFVQRVSRAWLARSTLAVLMALASVVIYRKGLGTTFFFDEWSWVIDRRPWRVDIFLTPYNGNLHLLPVTVFKILFVTVGLGQYWVYRLVLLGFHLACVALLFTYARRRVGDALAVIAATSILFLGTAWHDLLVPFQIGFLGSVAGGLAMLVALDRGTRAGDVVAAIALALSIASSTLGLAFATVALIELMWLRRARRLWVAALPLALYAVWYVEYRDSPQGVRASVGPLGDVLRANLPQLPSYMGDAAAAAVGGLFGLGVDWGQPLFVAGLGALIWWLGASRHISARLIGLLAGSVSYWFLLGAFRAQQVAPDASRYIYGGSVLVLLVALELGRNHRATTAAIALVALFAVFGVVGNLNALRAGSLSLQDASGHIRAEFGALELAGRSVDPNYMPDPPRTQNVRAGPYLETVRELGSPADTPAEIARLPEPLREEADLVLVRALGIDVVAGRLRERPGAALVVDALQGGTAVRTGSCVHVTPTGPSVVVDITLPPRGVVVKPEGRASVSYSARHFGDSFATTPIGSVAIRASSIRIPRAREPLAWHLRLATTEPLRMCRA
jgi:hypothetical protein